MKATCTLVIVGLLILVVTIELIRPSEELLTAVPEEFRTEKSRRMANPFDHPDQFAAYHADIRADEDSIGYPMNYRLMELEKARSAAKTQRTQQLEWKERGPNNAPGRTRGLIVDPDDPARETWFAGAVSGGLWKTTDGGDSWRSLTDHLPTLAISCLAMAGSNHDVIYMGTGEGFFSRAAVAGSGIFKSTDRGQSWKQLTSTVVNDDFRHVNRLAVDPGNENVVVAVTEAGIFRTNDGGTTWTRVYQQTHTDEDGVSFPAPVQDIRARPDDFNVQFAAVNGVGIVRSLDAGLTWKLSLGEFSRGVARLELAIAPSNPNVVYTSVESHEGSDLYRSDDGGNTWAPTLDSNESNPIDWLENQGWYDQTLAVHPYSPDTVYLGGVGLWLAYMSPDASGRPSGPTEVQGEGTDSFLGIETFTDYSHFEGMLQAGHLNSKVVDMNEEDFTSVEIRFGQGKQMAHRFSVSKTGGTNRDGGAGIRFVDYDYEDYVEVPFQVWDIDRNRQLMLSFRDQNDNGEFELKPRTSEGSRNDQSREYMFIHEYEYDGAQPHPRVALDGGVINGQLYSLWPVLAHGETWNSLNVPESKLRIRPAGTSSYVRVMEEVLPVHAPHVDHHNLIMIPTDTAAREFMILNANDGGVYYSEDKGARWIGAGRGYNTTQFYDVDKRSGVNQYIGGTQDNGTWKSYENPNARRGWQWVLSGDGFDVVWHSKNENLVLASIYYNGIYRSVDQGGNFGDGTNGINDNGQFVTSLGNSKSDPDVVYTIGSSGIWRSDDFANSWTSVPINPDLWGWGSSGKVRVSLATPEVVWAGFRLDDDPPGTGTIHVSQDQGRTFKPAAVPRFAPSNVISGLATHPHDDGTGYVLFSAPKKPKILKTADFGQTWEDLSGFVNSQDGKSTNGFPDVAVYDLLVLPRTPEVMWVGTEIGIFVSHNGGSWSYMDDELPAVSVWRMKIVDDQVVLATHGRGIWTLDLEQAVAVEEVEKEIPSAYSLEQNYPNPFNTMTTISFSVPEQSNVKLTVYDVAGRRVATLTDREYATGMHQVNWDAGGQASGMYFYRMEVVGQLMQTRTMRLVK